MPNKLANQVVMITGASSGFGADAARLFAKEGCIVILAARRMNLLTELVEQIRQGGGRAFALSLDISEQSQIDEAARTVLDNFGRVDILFNNAGFGSMDWLEVLEPAAEIDKMLDINLRGLIQMTRAVLPSMLAHRSGTIINMSSVAGLIAAPTHSVYAATKFGIRGFTNGLRREVAPFGLHVCGLYPGPASTEFGQHSGSNHIVKDNFKVLGWLNMSSAYVARCTVGLAKHPRRALVIPWWFGPMIAFDSLFPGLVDWFVKIVFVKRFHKLMSDDQA